MKLKLIRYRYNQLKPQQISMTDFLSSSIKQFQYYKDLGESTFEQIPEEKLFWKPNEEGNSIATIVKHLHGNMMSR